GRSLLQADRREKHLRPSTALAGSRPAGGSSRQGAGRRHQAGAHRLWSTSQRVDAVSEMGARGSEGASEPIVGDRGTSRARAVDGRAEEQSAQTGEVPLKDATGSELGHHPMTASYYLFALSLIALPRAEAASLSWTRKL